MDIPTKLPGAGVRDGLPEVGQLQAKLS